MPSGTMMLPARGFSVLPPWLSVFDSDGQPQQLPPPSVSPVWSSPEALRRTCSSAARLAAAAAAANVALAYLSNDSWVGDDLALGGQRNVNDDAAAGWLPLEGSGGGGGGGRSRSVPGAWGSDGRLPVMSHFLDAHMESQLLLLLLADSDSHSHGNVGDAGGGGGSCDAVQDIRVGTRGRRGSSASGSGDSGSDCDVTEALCPAAGGGGGWRRHGKVAAPERWAACARGRAPVVANNSNADSGLADNTPMADLLLLAGHLGASRATEADDDAALASQSRQDSTGPWRRQGRRSGATDAELLAAGAGTGYSAPLPLLPPPPLRPPTGSRGAFMRGKSLDAGSSASASTFQRLRQALGSWAPTDHSPSRPPSLLAFSASGASEPLPRPRPLPVATGSLAPVTAPLPPPAVPGRPLYRSTTEPEVSYLAWAQLSPMEGLVDASDPAAAVGGGSSPGSRSSSSGQPSLLHGIVRMFRSRTSAAAAAGATGGARRSTSRNQIMAAAAAPDASMPESLPLRAGRPVGRHSSLRMMGAQWSLSPPASPLSSPHLPQHSRPFTRVRIESCPTSPLEGGGGGAWARPGRPDTPKARTPSSATSDHASNTATGGEEGDSGGHSSGNSAGLVFWDAPGLFSPRAPPVAADTVAALVCSPCGPVAYASTGGLRGSQPHRLRQLSAAQLL